ncbi:unnamed protein product [Kuraishia capsulata CBS 1993]|uniref:Uncharacterized protein n=1 Tax=Kuraishia capsulata CBS 1993 TaxID=1382522 RepID=W6MXN1_9ASCO|nr:uncharacterized protein KUCA_T00005167001 [Kuraishia capsulata CBS 1993]CDK29180.1 unnamed protein product [Kuraishia capsulata CBS 1993]
MSSMAPSWILDLSFGTANFTSFGCITKPFTWDSAGISPFISAVSSASLSSDPVANDGLGMGISTSSPPRSSSSIISGTASTTNPPVPLTISHNSFLSCKTVASLAIDTKIVYVFLLRRRVRGILLAFLGGCGIGPRAFS